MRYFGKNTYNQFTSVPIRTGYSQDLVGIMPFAGNVRSNR